MVLRTQKTRIAFDATPLLGRPTGIGVFTRGLLEGLIASLLEESEQRPTEGVEAAEMSGARSVTDLTEGLMGRAVDIMAYALSVRGYRALAHSLPTGVARVEAPMPAGLLLRVWGRVDFPRIEAWTGQVDIVHGTNFVVPPTKAASLVTVHDLTAVRFPELCEPTTLRYPALVKRAVDRGAHVHVPTRAVADEVIELLQVPDERVHVIPHGLSPLPLTTTDAGRELVGFERYVLTMGTIEPRKDHAALVRAFDLVADEDHEVALVIAGADGWGAAQLTAAIDNARHPERIVRLAYVDAVARAALLRGASAFVFPSVYEGFGIPPLEAMQAGVPVVTTAVDAVVEVTRDAAVHVAIGDDGAMASAINDVLSDRDGIRARLVEAGEKLVSDMTWKQSAEQFLQLYEELGS